jgi:MYXO-CTERM domain-containing protein
VEIAWTLKKWIIKSRSGPLLGLAAAIATLLLAAPAGAETIAETNLPAATTTVASAPAEQPQTSAGSTSPEPSGAALESASAGEDAPVSPTPAPSVEDSSPEAPAPSRNLAATTNASAAAVSDAAPRLAATAASAADRGKIDSATRSVPGVSVPASVEPDAIATPISGHRVSKLAEDIDRNLAETITTAVDRLPATRVLPALQPTDLLDSVAPAIAEGPPPSEASPASGVSLGGEARSFLPEMPRASLFLDGGSRSGPLTDVYPTQPGDAEIAGIRASSSSHRESALSLAGAPDATPADTSAHHGGSPAPTEVPLPAPSSPATAVPDSGGPSFVPIVALLALLALVASAALRRLGRAADFRAPNPFICALERPG